MSFATKAMIQRWGLPWVLRATAINLFFTNLPATLVLRNRDEYIHPKKRIFDTRLVRRYDVFLLLSWSFISTFGYITLLFSLPDYGKSIEMEGSQAAEVAAFVNLRITVGRPLIESPVISLDDLELLYCSHSFAASYVWLSGFRLNHIPPSSSFPCLVAQCWKYSGLSVASSPPGCPTYQLLKR